MEKNKYLQVRENNFTNQEEGYQMSGDEDTNDKKWKTKGGKQRSYFQLYFYFN